MIFKTDTKIDFVDVNDTSFKNCTLVLTFLGGGDKNEPKVQKGKYNVHDMDRIKKTFIRESAIFSRMRKKQRLTIKQHLLLIYKSEII